MRRNKYKVNKQLRGYYALQIKLHQNKETNDPDCDKLKISDVYRATYTMIGVYKTREISATAAYCVFSAGILVWWFQYADDNLAAKYVLAIVGLSGLFIYNVITNWWIIQRNNLQKLAMNYENSERTGPLSGPFIHGNVFESKYVELENLKKNYKDIIKFKGLVFGMTLLKCFTLLGFLSFLIIAIWNSFD